MKWHLPDLPLLIHHLPREVAGLQSRENKELVEAGIAHAPQPTADLFANPPPALQAYLGQ